MKTKNKSVTSSTKSKAAIVKPSQTKLGRGIVSGLTEVLAHIRGGSQS